MAKERFADVIFSYINRDNQIRLTVQESELAMGRTKNYEKLFERRTSSGFYGVAFRDKVANEIVLAIAGSDFTTGFGKFITDLDDTWLSASGGVVSQEKDAEKFAKEIQSKFGKIDYITGHSLGGYLSLYLTGSGNCGNAKCFAYDPPNVTRTMISNCMLIGKLSEQDVVNNFRNNCLTVSITPNSYNCLGAPPGISLISNNNPNSLWRLFPKEHVYAENEFLHALQKTETFVQRTDGSDSGLPLLVTAFMTGLSALAFSPELKKGLKTIQTISSGS